ncbi:hypothetical protein BDD12DRAFT_312293 [Trichophaea hybrida]|nr:hypothetical protein BDD12DRAFT_312293 [Trichophaea hybrida]
MNLAHHPHTTRRPLEPPTSLTMNHHHPPPPRFITCVQSLQQYQHQLIFTAGILLAWFLLSELLRSIIRAARRNAPRSPVDEYTNNDGYDDNYDAEESDYSLSSPEFTPDPPDIKSPSPDIVKKERLSPFTPPRTPLRQRLTSIPLPPRVSQTLRTSATPHFPLLPHCNPAPSSSALAPTTVPSSSSPHPIPRLHISHIYLALPSRHGQSWSCQRGRGRRDGIKKLSW